MRAEAIHEAIPKVLGVGKSVRPVVDPDSLSGRFSKEARERMGKGLLLHLVHFGIASRIAHTSYFPQHPSFCRGRDTSHDHETQRGNHVAALRLPCASHPLPAAGTGQRGLGSEKGPRTPVARPIASPDVADPKKVGRSARRRAPLKGDLERGAWSRLPSEERPLKPRRDFTRSP